MDDQGITDVAVADAPAPDAVAESTSIMNTDGTFTDGWRESLPEDIRGESVFDRVKDFNGMAKSLAHAERMIGKDKIVIPNENSSEQEWATWNKAHGMPETAESYQFNMPDGVEADADITSKAAPVFHELGLNQKQVDGIVSLYEGMRADASQMSEAAIVNAKQELHDSLLTEWGNAFEQKKHIGNLAIDQAVDGDSEFQERLTRKFGDDPDFIKAMSNLGAKFVEHGAVPSTVQVADTPDVLEGKIKDLMASDAYMNKRHANHKTVMTQVQNLYKQKHQGK